MNSEFPISPRRVPFFYGWVVLLGAVIGIIMSIPGQTAGVSVFTDALIAATGLSRVEFSVTYLLGTLASGFLLPWGGRVLDVKGARLTAMTASAGLGLSLVCLSQIDKVAASIPGIPVQISMLATLALGFAFLRFTGQGMLTLSCRTMFARWFVRRRGFVSAVMGVFVALSFSFSPKVLSALIHEVESWRTAWLILAVGTGIGMTFIAWLLFRDSPETVGLQPDGLGDLAEKTEPEEIDGATRTQALRSVPLWVVVLALSIQSMVITGTTFHMYDLGREMGRSASFMENLFPPLAVVSAVVAFAAGYLSDRFSLRPLLATMLLGETVAYLGFGFLGEVSGYWTVIAAGGLTSGLFGTLTNVALAKLFGRKHLGSILGIQMSGLVIGSALGPAYLALCKVYAGSYFAALCLAAFVPLIPLSLLVIGGRGFARTDAW